MKPIQLPDWGEHLWFIELEPRKRVEVPRMDAQGNPIKLNGEQVTDIQYKHGKVLRRDATGVPGEEGDIMAFGSEQAAQDFIDTLPRPKAEPKPPAESKPAAVKKPTK
jgi:hypothetical protein